ncbi:uncharacterized protein LOC122019178 [Zingiber officinale]|uniref:uncharacterized protein LOC122019178 n=1 Tax=Zingiber officinale TaxID=94328 RepID=UPI001C4B9556|nr:uncharacterized protein LOC122019178 [Zingiber officinale]
MILGFISLLLTFSQDQIVKICVPKAVADSMLLCRPDAESTGRNKRWLLALVLTESHLKRRILAAGGSVEKEQLITATGLHQLHILIFFLAVFHVVNSALIMVLGRAKIHRWKDWEKDTTSAEYAFTTSRLLEQASYYYLLSIPPMLRKYDFHLVLSGNRYYISDQRQHAIRAYRNALFVYRENGWSYISNHVHYNVGRFSMLCLYICAFIFDAFNLISFHLLTWYSFIGVLDLAIKHMLEVLACSHLSLATQNAFLNEFSHVVQSMGMKFEVYNLRIPVINMASLKRQINS